MDITAIVAVDKNWAIGCGGKLLTSIPGDMKFFRETTSGHTIVMGRVTLESFPEGKPLKNRRNIVLSRDEHYGASGAEIVHSTEEAVSLLKTIEDDIYIIGGEQIYREFLPYCNRALVTKIDYAYEADSYFPDLDKDEDWELISESDENSCFDLLYKFTEYKRK